MTIGRRIPFVNQEIRHAVKTLMKERGITQEQLAKQLEMKRTNLNQMLNADTEIPQRWQDIFDALGKKIALVDTDGPK